MVPIKIGCVYVCVYIVYKFYLYSKDLTDKNLNKKIGTKIVQLGRERLQVGRKLTINIHSVQK